MSNGKWTCRDNFKVTHITYVGRKIKTVEVYDMSSRTAKTFKTDAKEYVEPEPEPDVDVRPTATQIENIKKVIDKHGLNLAGIMIKANVLTLDNLSTEDYNRIVQITRNEVNAKNDAKREAEGDNKGLS